MARVPDLRGEFVRGWDHGRGADTGRVLGSKQAQALKSHHHIGLYNSPYGTGLYYNYGYKHNGVNTGVNYGMGAFPRLGLGLHDNKTTTAIKTGDTGGTETRPRNVALMFVIKY